MTFYSSHLFSALRQLLQQTNKLKTQTSPMSQTKRVKHFSTMLDISQKWCHEKGQEILSTCGSDWCLIFFNYIATFSFLYSNIFRVYTNDDELITFLVEKRHCYYYEFTTIKQHGIYHYFEHHYYGEKLYPPIMQVFIQPSSKVTSFQEAFSACFGLCIAFFFFF